MTITEAFDTFERNKLLSMADKTRQNYRSALNSFVRVNTDVEVKHIMVEHIARWNQYLVRDGNQPSSVQTYLSKLRKVLRFLKTHGYDVLDPDLIELPKVPESEKSFLDFSEVESFIDAAERLRDKAIIACLWSTGCRISELLSLNVDDIRSRGNEVHIRGKGSHIRPVYIDPRAMAYLEAYLESRTDRLKPLFLSGQCRRITPGRVNQIFHEIINKTAIEKRVTPHTMRHSFATDLLTNGADVREAQVLLGHKSIASTQIYTHITDRHKKKVFAEYHTV